MAKGRKPQADYSGIAEGLLQELGGGPIRTRELLELAQEKGLLPSGKWTYHNFVRAIKLSGPFDLSQHGKISLLGAVDHEEDAQEAEEAVAAAS